MALHDIHPDHRDASPKGEQRDRAITALIMLILRVVLLAGAAIAVSWPLTTTVGWVSCGLGAGLGILLGTWLGGSRVRHWVVVSASVLGVLIGLLMAESLVSWDWPTALFGGRGTLEMAEILRWGAGGFFVMVLLRTSSHRYEAAAVLELMLPLLAAASLFSAHRGGNLHRPQSLVDLALERGREPTWYLRLLGLGGAMFLAIGLLRLRRGVQVFGAMALLLLLFLSMYVIADYTPKSTLLSMKEKFGKTGKEKPQKQPARSKQGKGKSKKKRKRPKGGREKKKHMKFNPRIRRKREKQKVVAVVIFNNQYKPPSNVYYFRQRILSQFSGVRLVRASRGDVDRDRISHFPAPDTQTTVPNSVQPPKGIMGLKQRFAALDAKKKKQPRATPGASGLSPGSRKIVGLLQMLRKEQRELAKKEGVYLKRVQTVVAIRFDHDSPFGLTAPRRFRGLINPNPRVFLRSYLVDSWAWAGHAFPKFRVQKDENLPELLARYYPLLKLKVGESWWPKDVREFYTRPPEDPRYKALLEKILKPLAAKPEIARQPLAKAFAIKRYLQNKASYSMRLRTPPDIRDQVAYFLFHTRIGYCVHFSHAAVYLMRLAGIPARVAEGYAVPARERGSTSALLIKAGAAHAWPEVYIRGLGWTTFDIYPRRNLDAQRPRPPDPKRRQLMANMARPKKIPPLKRDEKKARKKSRSISWKWLGTVARFPWYWIPVLVLLLLFSLKLWRRHAYLWASKELRLWMFYRSLEDRLSEHGIRREPGQTLEHFGEQHEATMPALSLLFHQMSARHLGSHMADLDDPQTQSLIGELLAQFRGAFPWYWRLLRSLDPISWAQHVFVRWQHFPPIWWLKWLEIWEGINERLERVLFLFRRSP